MRCKRTSNCETDEIPRSKNSPKTNEVKTGIINASKCILRCLKAPRKLFLIPSFAVCFSLDAGLGKPNKKRNGTKNKATGLSKHEIEIAEIMKTKPRSNCVFCHSDIE